MTPSLTILQGDALSVLKTLPGDSVHCVVTSPPFYGLRDYSVSGQIGLEPTLDEFLSRLVSVFDEARRVLHPSGVCFVDMGDSYARQAGDDSTKAKDSGMRTGRTGRSEELFKTGSNTPPAGLKPKDRCLVPFRLALRLQEAGWWVRDVIAWTKPAPMPESVTDRCTQSWEPILMLTKGSRYFFDCEAVKEKAATGFNGSSFTDPRDHATKHNLGNGERTDTGLRNLRNTWSIGPEPFTDTVLDANGKPVSHFAAFPSALPRRCILAATSARGVCPKCGEPWTRQLSERNNASYGGGDLAVGKQREWKRSSHCGPNDQVDYEPPRTIGWQPGCECEAGQPVPATVLDIFLGTGTTAAVALELGRNAIGIELSPDYIRLAERRCNAVTPGLALA